MNAPIILIGGRSRAARAVRAAMASRTCLGVVRADPAKNEVATPDYAAVPGDLDLAGATIVNCVGSPQGDPAQLMHLNRDVPAAWASAASERGARSMVHISSFSIFGLAETVANGTEPAPVNAYGASKLAAEEALAQIDAQGFPVCRLRVPILVGGGPDKLAQLVRLARRTGFVPRASRPTPRSMLPYEGLAHAISIAIDRRISGPACAADPEPFTAQMLQDEARRAGRRVRTVTMPRMLTSAIAKARPALHASLFAPNILDEASNLLADEAGYERLRDVVARLVRE